MNYLYKKGYFRVTFIIYALKLAHKYIFNTHADHTNRNTSTYGETRSRRDLNYVKLYKTFSVNALNLTVKI